MKENCNLSTYNQLKQIVDRISFYGLNCAIDQVELHNLQIEQMKRNQLDIQEKLKVLISKNKAQEQMIK